MNCLRCEEPGLKTGREIHAQTKFSLQKSSISSHKSTQRANPSHLLVQIELNVVPSFASVSRSLHGRQQVTGLAWSIRSYRSLKTRKISSRRLATCKEPALEEIETTGATPDILKWPSALPPISLILLQLDTLTAGALHCHWLPYLSTIQFGGR